MRTTTTVTAAVAAFGLLLSAGACSDSNDNAHKTPTTAAHGTTPTTAAHSGSTSTTPTTAHRSTTSTTTARGGSSTSTSKP
jgi:hypothetical protein